MKKVHLFHNTTSDFFVIKSADYIATLTKLKILDVCGCDLVIESLVRIVNSLPNLEIVSAVPTHRNNNSTSQFSLVVNRMKPLILKR